MERKTTVLCRISEEIMVSILSRLPPKSVMRFRCVRKSWYSLINNSSFIEKHLYMCNEQHSTSIFCKRFVLRDIKTNEWEVVFSSVTLANTDEQDTPPVVDDIRIPPSFDATTKGNFTDIRLLFAASIIGHCDGIICIQFGLGSSDIIVLWNPAIKNFKILPKQCFPTGVVAWMAFGYDPKSRDYKLLNIPVPTELVPIDERIVFELPKVEVYTLSTNSWREINSCSLETETTMFVPMYYSMYFNGFCYWIACEKQKEYLDRFDRDDDEYARQVILSFDTSNEIFDQVLLPTCLYETMARYFDMHIIPWNECIALFGLYSLIDIDVICGMHDAFGVWVLNSFGNVKSSWTKQLTLDVVMGIEKELVLWKKDEMLMVGKDGRIFTHNFETQKFKYINTSGHGVHPDNTDAVICVNSIVPVTFENQRA